MVADVIERELVIEAPAERVWALITESEHVGTWFGDVGAEIELRPGGLYRLTWKEHGTSIGRIVTVEPHTRFSYRWNAYGPKWREEPEDGYSTLVEFTLEPRGSATLLRLVESGFASLVTDDDIRTTAFDGNVRGWAAELGELQEYATRVAA
ncbi:SRPBCC family protein [Patulibacter sp. NPDC049589]|uniref:SRPBCC family protein n=1 Tax=Patulibacter sp. NPDC049589 TaxID=3154731 RepID=UPI003426EE32